MALTEKLRLLIEADPRNAVQAFEKVGTAAEREGRKAERNLDRVGSSMTKIGASMLGLGTLAGVGLVKAAKATSDLNEATSLTVDIFGDAADEIGEFAKGASSIGQSERAAREATATFGGLLKNLEFASDETVTWSKDLTTLASDMGSAFNKDPAVAVEALGSALRGESEPIRQFNVMLDDASVRAKAVELGLADTAAEVDNYGKTQGRLAIIMEQTADIQGNYLRTADDAANATRNATAEFENMQANLGQAMLPIMEQVLGIGNDLLGWFNDLDPATQKVISQFAVFGAGGLVLVGALTSVVGQAIKMRDTFGSLSPKMKTAGLALAGFTAALTVGVIAYQAWTKESKRAEQNADTFLSLIESGTDDVESFGRAMLDMLGSDITKMLDRLGVKMDDVVDAARAGGPEWDAFRDGLRESADAAGYNRVAVDLLDKAMVSVQGSMESATEEAELNASVMGDVEDSAFGARNELKGYAKQTDDAADSTEDAAEELSDMEKRLKDAATEAGKLKVEIIDLDEAMSDYLDETFSLAEAHDDFLDSLDDLSQSLKTNGTDIDSNSAKARANRDALREVVTEAGAIIGIMVEEGAAIGAINAERDLMIGKLKEVGRELGVAEADLDEYVEAILGIPTEARTTVTVGGLTEEIARVRFLRTLLNVGNPQIKITPNQLGTIPTRAVGGPVSAGQLYRGGERGFEVFEGASGKNYFIPGENGNVVPNHQLSGAGGSRVVNITVNPSPGMDERALADAVARAARRGFGG